MTLGDSLNPKTRLNLVYVVLGSLIAILMNFTSKLSFFGLNQIRIPSGIGIVFSFLLVILMWWIKKNMI